MKDIFKKVVALFTTVVMAVNVIGISANSVKAAGGTAENFVMNVYETLLHRKADQGGLTHWTTLLKSGSYGGANVVSAILDSDEYKFHNYSDAETLENIYNAMLFRNPDSAGYSHWLNFLHYGASYDYIINGFSTCDEFKMVCSRYGISTGTVKLTQSRDKNIPVTKFVASCYYNILGRAPDADGLNHWTNVINTKTLYPEDLIKSFINSAECAPHVVSNADFVTVLYKGFLGREPDDAGKAAWVSLLNVKDRNYAMEQFIKTDEFKNVLKSYGLTTRPAPPPKPATPAKPTLNAKTKMVALTFDDGPYSPVTNRILNSLSAVNGHATFFVVGNRLPTYPSCVKRAESMGCEIGNHTYDHKATLTSMSASSVRSEISGCNNSINSLLGHNPKIMRPVGGAYNTTVKQNVGMPMINWSLDTQDWKNRNTQSVANAILKNVKDGDIILCHDLYPTTAAAMEIVIPELVRRGYKLVTVSEMANARGVKLQNGNVYTAVRP